MTPPEQHCCSCTFFHPTEKKRLHPSLPMVKLGKCANEECLWHDMERMPDDGDWCPDYEWIGPYTGGGMNDA